MYIKSPDFVLIVWIIFNFISVQSLSRVRLFATPRMAAPQASLSITNSQYFQLKDNCFTMFWWFLPYNNMNQPKVYTSATWREELTHWKRAWCWERLRAGGKAGGRGWDGWIASSTQWTWVWANSGRWWRTGKPGVLQFMGSQRVRHDLATEQ